MRNRYIAFGYRLSDGIVTPHDVEAELVRLAQFAKAEMSLFETHLDICQQVQPESEEAFAAVKDRFEEVGAAVLEFLGRYGSAELEALGVPEDGRFVADTEQQRNMLRAEFPRLDEDTQRNACTDLRAAILNMEPKAPVTRF